MTLAVLCPGQGGQHAEMLAPALAHPAGRAVLDAAERALGASLASWAEDEATLFANATAQPLLCVAQLATWNVLAPALPPPVAVAGYSVGELAACGVAGALDAAELARLARARAQAMDTAAASHPGGLVASRGLARRAIDRVCAMTGAVPAIVIGDDAFVLGAPAGALDAVQDALRAAGGQVTCLRVGVPSHTPLMADAVSPFRAAVEASAMRDPRWPVVAGVSGAMLRRRTQVIDALASALVAPVQWSEVLTALHERGCRVFLELGPGQALSRTVRERFDDAQARSIAEFRSVDAAVHWVRRQMG